MFPLRSEAAEAQGDEESSPAEAASERNGNNLKGFNDFYLNAKARIWPWLSQARIWTWLSYMCRFRSRGCHTTRSGLCSSHANVASSSHIRQPSPDFDLGVQVKVLVLYVPISLESSVGVPHHEVRTLQQPRQRGLVERSGSVEGSYLRLL